MDSGTLPIWHVSGTKGTGMANRKGRKASFGSLRRLPSGRIQARYTGPDGLTRQAPVTFDTKTDAQAWLATVRADMVRGLWRPQGKGRPLTFEDYATAWLADRTLKAADP